MSKEWRDEITLVNGTKISLDDFIKKLERERPIPIDKPPYHRRPTVSKHKPQDQIKPIRTWVRIGNKLMEVSKMASKDIIKKTRVLLDVLKEMNKWATRKEIDRAYPAIAPWSRDAFRKVMNVLEDSGAARSNGNTNSKRYGLAAEVRLTAIPDKKPTIDELAAIAKATPVEPQVIQKATLPKKLVIEIPNLTITIDFKE